MSLKSLKASIVHWEELRAASWKELGDLSVGSNACPLCIEYNQDCIQCEIGQSNETCCQSNGPYKEARELFRALCSLYRKGMSNGSEAVMLLWNQWQEASGKMLKVLEDAVPALQQQEIKLGTRLLHPRKVAGHIIRVGLYKYCFIRDGQYEVYNWSVTLDRAVMDDMAFTTEEVDKIFRDPDWEIVEC